MRRTISVGDKVDSKYRIVRKLGRGGFGEVYLAEDELLGRQVAIKLLRDSDPGRQADLIHEMRSLDQLHHPSVVTFYHHFIHEEMLFLVMEFCAGGSLRDRMWQQRAAPLAVMEWGRDLTDTLQFVHQHGIVHHDIKPDNLLFTSDGVLKVGDFGVANRIAGTIRYLAPEMSLGGVDASDARVDVYALGITLLELLVNHNPFDGVPEMEVLGAKIRHQFVPTELDGWVQEVLSKATHPTPELRFQSMQEFREAIESKHVSYVFDRSRVQAHALAARAERHLGRHQIASAALCIRQALFACPDCVSAVIAAGRWNLFMNCIPEARQKFDEALSLNPRANIQRELGWLCLESGNYSRAISLLTDHLQRNAADYEAYNLLLECFYRTDRYDAGIQVAHLMIDEAAPSECFDNNGFLCCMLAGATEEDLVKRGLAKGRNSFINYNLDILTQEQEIPKSLLLFEGYQFGLSGRKAGAITIKQDGTQQEYGDPLITVGRLSENLICLTDNHVSRRHCVLVNQGDNLWLYDLDSTHGVFVDGEKVDRKIYLGGVHVIRLGRTELTLCTKPGLLV